VTEAGRQALPFAASNMLEYWTGSFGDRWWDMAALVRLGAAVEISLRDTYRVHSDGTKPPDGIFQRLVRPDELVALFTEHLGLNLTLLPQWQTMRELMVHRHLYAHRSGAVDERYVADVEAVTGKPIRDRLATAGYPDEDIYWFEPLAGLPGFIEAARTFVAALPT
jgi:hypothetical protein